jgi:membrane protease YdiL (CAAX protease family)
LLLRFPTPGPLVSAPAQEFLYRGFLHAELTAARVPLSGVVIISAFLYSFMHIIYRDYLTVALTFVLGLVLSAAFAHTHSFYVVALSHAALGTVAIALGAI